MPSEKMAGNFISAWREIIHERNKKKKSDDRYFII